MERFFTLKNPKDNIHLLAFQYHTIEYSIGILKKRKMELRNNPSIRYKIDNYLMMQRLSFSQELQKDDLPFDIKENIKTYLNNPNNRDLKQYLNICKHIVAKELDMKEICSKVDFNDHLFMIRGIDLYCVDCKLSTEGKEFNDIDKKFLCSCARKKNKIVRISDSGNASTLYNGYVERDINNLVQFYK